MPMNRGPEENGRLGRAAAPAEAEAIDHYLRTGDADPLGFPWPGNVIERCVLADRELRAALIREVRRHEKGRTRCGDPAVDVVALTRGKVEPMVRGLFPRAEVDTVLDALERSAWTLANLYLRSIGSEPLGDDEAAIVGLSIETTCFVTPAALEDEDPFEDFIVHEAAHVFHNCRRETLGLHSTRRREWLLEIDFRERETFAYACEAFSRIHARARTPAERRRLAAEYAAEPRVPEDAADEEKVAEIVTDAAAARNGWKVILARCAPARTPGP
jgi:hypothetical protein